MSREKTPSTPAIRCAIYTRKSSEEGLDLEFNSLDAQRESAEAFIASQQREGWVCLPEHYDDGGFSGGSMDRPALNRLLGDIAAGKVDCVVVYKVDRLGRSLLDFARIMETFDKNSASFVSVTQQFNTTHSMGRLTLNVLLSFAQFEREIIGERIRDKIAAQRRKGKWAGGVPVLGYDIDRTNPSPKLVINAEEATQVRRIFSLYLELGSLLPVAEELARRGWRNKAWTTKKGGARGGRAFDKCSVYALLTNPIYIGKIKHKADIYDGEHPPIIDAAVFQKVQLTLQQHGRGRGNCLINKYGALLKGLLNCQACGQAMVHTFTGRGSKRYRYYTCIKAIKSGWATCPTKSLPAAEIEATVVDQIRCIARDAELRDEVLRQACSATDTDVGELATQRQQLERQLARDHAEIRRMTLLPEPSSATTARIADLHERVARAEQQLAQVRNRLDEVERQRINEADVSAAFADFDNVWNALSSREQAQVLRLLVARVEFDPAESTVAISFHPSAIKSLAEANLEDVA
ncbi:MAG TPA: recombinase family protein [Pirellulales bacterium]|jgi:site-specific DNA recombinase|nr:recombinase family protein [Pirellulales bacterium]